MEVSYIVLLKPSDIRFNTNAIRDKFDNNIPLTETLNQLQNDEITLDDIPEIEVVWSQQHWEWYTLNNRRLWVLKELEKDGLCKFIKTRRREDVSKIDCPNTLYGSVRFRGRGEARTLNITCSRDSSPRYVEERPLQRHQREGSIEYSETRVKIEHNIVSSEEHNSMSYRSYQETRTCKYSECRSGPLSLRPSRSYHQHLPYKSSSLAKLHPSQRFYSRARELGYRSCTRETQRPVYGLVSYGFWHRRRREFFQKFFSLRTDRIKRGQKCLPDILHTCGVCYKSFRRQVSLEQHCEELLHYACIPCGKFFTSYTALGQHRLARDHYLKLR